MNSRGIINQFNKLNIVVTPQKLEQLEKYFNFLIEENKKYNLTNITAEEEVYLKHFYDSLVLANYYDLNQDLKVLDIGSGAGFPGIVLKIFFPNLKLYIVESLKKRVNFLEELVKLLNLQDVDIKHDRAEIYSQNHEEEFDIITGRAVIKSSSFLEMSVRALKVNGLIILYKGKEENVSKTLLKELDLSYLKTEKFFLPYEKSDRSFVFYKKLKTTNRKYPREFKEIKNKPL